MKKIFTLTTALFLSFVSMLAFSQVRISQVYGGGGNGSATYNQDFVEIYNAGAAVTLNGWSIQYASATGPTGTGNWSRAIIPDNTTIGAGKYFLVALATGATGVALPAPDLTITSVNLSGTTGKVALVSDSNALNGTTACSNSLVVDVLGYGSGATCSETSPFIPTGITNAQSMFRKLNGCTDLNNNSSDFELGTVAPRNSATAANVCSNSPALSLTAATGLTTTSGVASASQTFSLSGSGLTGAPGNITVTAAGTSFEVSLSSGSGFGSSVTVPYTTGTLANTTLYTRISATAPLGAVTGNVTASGGGAADTTTVMRGNVLVAEPSTQATNVLLTGATDTSLTVNWTNGNGAGRIVVIHATAGTAVDPLDARTFTATTTIATAPSLGSGNYVVYSGTGTGPVTVTGLASGTSYTVTVYEYNGGTGTINYLTTAATGNPAAASTTGISSVLTQVNFTGLAVPLYTGSGTATRTPTMFYARLTNLTPNTVYRYYTQAGISTDLGGSNGGAGNSILLDYTVSPVTYAYSSGPSLTSAGNYGKFSTNAAGSFSGSFGFVNTGNARFTAGNSIFPTIVLGTDASTTVQYRFALDQTITVLAFATTAGPNDGTFIQGTSSAIPGNLVALWDNTTATGRPTSITLAENPTFTGTWATGFITGYDLTAGSWNTIIPNSNANGTRLIQQMDKVTGAVIGCNSDADGTWPTGTVVTGSPAGGTTPLQISSTDAPLNGGSCFGVVPVKFEYLNGHKSNSSIALNWKVTCLSTSIVMEIERSSDARNFASIYALSATQARCSEPFNFSDAQPLKGKNFYRLKMIDVDGKVSYSPTVVVINGATGFEFVGLYPTTVASETVLSITSAKATVIETSISDASGRVVKTFKQSIPAGSSLLKVDCSNLASGIYNLTGTAANESKTTLRFVKL